MSKRLLLWGDTQSGKSTLLTTAIFSPDVKQLIDTGKSRESLYAAGILNAKRAMEEGRVVPGTADRVDVDLVPLADGDPISIRDIRGLSARDLSERPSLDEASGVLFVVEWAGPTFQNQMATVAQTVDLISPKTIKFGLAITKSERILLKEDAAWTARGLDRWWEKYPCWKDYSEAMRAMGDCIWVTSAYGYHDRRPAALLGEFGDWFPYKTQPINVGRPFAWFFKEFAA